MSDYKKEARNAKRSANRGLRGVPDSFINSEEDYITNINETDKRFITYQCKIFDKNIKNFIGLYTIIIDTNTKTAKEIMQKPMSYNVAYIKNVEFNDNGIYGDSIAYDSTLRDGYHVLNRSKK